MKLFFRKSGEGKPLLIMHGLFGMSDNWSTLSKQFSEKGFLVYIVDARNHGRSPHSDEFDFPLMSADMIELMDDEKIQSANIIGHSMGGKTAMWMACENPNRISKLLVADMAPRFYAPHHEGVIAAIHAADPAIITSRKEAEKFLRESLHDEGTIQFLLKNLYWNENEKLDWRFNLNGIEKNLSNIGIALPEHFRFSGRTLFLRGEKSGYITETDKTDILKHFPSAEIKTVPDAGHWIHAENPSGFMNAALEFLNGK
jgi:esterase